MTPKHFSLWNQYVDFCFKKKVNEEATEHEKMILAVDIYIREMERKLSKKKVAAILLEKIK